jgi:hypothetical protein
VTVALRKFARREDASSNHPFGKLLDTTKRNLRHLSL